MKVRIVVPARDEQQRLGAMLHSLQRSVQYCEQGARYACDIVVVLDRCTDQSRQIAERAGVSVRVCPLPFGKVEALRAGMDPAADAHVFVDADVLVGERTLRDLLDAIARDSTCLAACPPLAVEPLAGVPTPLAWALHRYNATRGFSSERLWLSGRCYAVRGRVEFPTPADVKARIAHLPLAQRSGPLAMPLSADDVWLSRALLARAPDSIQHIVTDPVAFRAPRSLRGMSRTWRRLRRELRRVDVLFPELRHHGRARRTDRVHGLRDVLALTLFRAALWLCEQHARIEDLRVAYFGHTPDPWPVVQESKA